MVIRNPYAGSTATHAPGTDPVSVLVSRSAIGIWVGNGVLSVLVTPESAAQRHISGHTRTGPRAVTARTTELFFPMQGAEDCFTR